MIDIKMSDYFSDDFKPSSMNVKITYLMPVVGNVSSELSAYHCELIIHAINSHDKLTQRVKELEDFANSIQLDSIKDEIRLCELMGREW
ncbi:hypothetical protein VPHK24_0024 [Vibrio phage K24]|nr:hypothetical protein SIPHO078v2_p0021 [Vibrio phage 14E30.1]